MVFPLAVGPVGVWNVPGRLLEVRHEAPPLEHFRQDVRHALARHVRAAELRNRVVAVFVQHARVQLVGAGRADRGAGRSAVSRNVASELIQEQTAQCFRRSRIAREQGALDGFRQVGQDEDRPVGVGEVRREGGRFFGCEDVGCEWLGHR